MTNEDLILAKLSKLSLEKQRKVISFIDFLILENTETQFHNEDLDWSRFSLSQAMSGMEDEDDLYTLSDLKEMNK